jgi:hypothetical protein
MNLDSAPALSLLDRIPIYNCIFSGLPVVEEGCGLIQEFRVSSTAPDHALVGAHQFGKLILNRLRCEVPAGEVRAKEQLPPKQKLLMDFDC